MAMLRVSFKTLFLEQILLMHSNRNNVHLIRLILGNTKCWLALQHAYLH